MVSLRSFFITFLIALVIFGVCAFFITGFVTDSINGLLAGDMVTETTEPPATDDSSEVVATLPNTDEEIEGESFNLLLIGTDYRPSILTNYHPDVASQYPTFENSELLIAADGRLPEYPFRTVSADAVMLVCVNKEKQNFTFMQIPSKMLLSVGGTSTTVGDLYYEKGLEYFVSKMSGITGVSIDYYAVTSIEQVANVVDALGTVTYTVPCDMEYTDEISGLNISLTAGAGKLGGKDAAGLLAFNGYTNPSLSREKTAVSFIKAVAQKMTSANYLTKAASILSNVQNYVYTNFTLDDLEKNLELIFKYGDFTVNTVEYSGSYYYSEDGTRYFNPNISGTITNLAKYK
ncbi:MAG: LCP family protein [Clostridia bacterium]|nr:LCP family protein [Clostridia bacterium]